MVSKSLAEELAGNWQQFGSFVWYRQREIDPTERDKWAIVYTHNRDSGLLDQSNASVIAKTLAPFTEGDNPDVVLESHHHFAVGHVDGFSIRVYDSGGQITPAFRTYAKLRARLDDYPILDEEDYSRREYEATLANVEDSAYRLKHEYDLPPNWVDEVYSWLSENMPGELENRDDQGGYPSEEALVEAFDALGFAIRYQSQCARDAQEQGYGDKTYWDGLEQHALELRDKFVAMGDMVNAERMLTRTLVEALRGNEGD